MKPMLNEIDVLHLYSTRCDNFDSDLLVEMDGGEKFWNSPLNEIEKRIDTSKWARLYLKINLHDDPFKSYFSFSNIEFEGVQFFAITTNFRYKEPNGRNKVGWRGTLIPKEKATKKVVISAIKYLKDQYGSNKEKTISDIRKNNKTPLNIENDVIDNSLGSLSKLITNNKDTAPIFIQLVWNILEQKKCYCYLAHGVRDQTWIYTFPYILLFIDEKNWNQIINKNITFFPHSPSPNSHSILEEGNNLYDIIIFEDRDNFRDFENNCKKNEDKYFFSVTKKPMRNKIDFISENKKIIKQIIREAKNGYDVDDLNRMKKTVTNLAQKKIKITSKQKKGEKQNIKPEIKVEEVPPSNNIVEKEVGIEIINQGIIDSIDNNLNRMEDITNNMKDTLET